MSQDQTDRLEGLERAERRRRVFWIVVAVVAAAVLAAYLFVPRTLISGEAGPIEWSLEVAPLALASDPVRVVGVEPGEAELTAVPRGRGLDLTQVWHIGDEYRGETIVVGRPPAGADSVRVTIDGPRPGTTRSVEVRLEQVGWRTYHVGAIRRHVEVTEIVAIDEDGVPIDVWQRGGSPDPAASDPEASSD